MRIPRRVPRTYVILLVLGGMGGFWFRDMRAKYGFKVHEFASELLKSYGSVSTLEEANFAEQMPRLLQKRRNILDMSCKRKFAPHKFSQIKRDNFIVNHKHRLVWCAMRKAASTTWFYNFAKLAGHEVDEVKHSQYPLIEFLRRTDYPTPPLKLLQKVLQNKPYTSFIIAREPLERLLSAYLDKIADLSRGGYDRLRCQILNIDEPRLCTPTFPEFVDYVIAEHTAGGAVNEYWDTYTNQCMPCVVNYTLILHFSALQDEQKVIFDKVSNTSELSNVRHHGSRTVYRLEIPKYYRQLNKTQMLSLIDIYIEDFLLFGFSYKRYLSYVE